LWSAVAYTWARYEKIMKITIAALSDSETRALTGSSRFNNLHPIHCHACGRKGPFERQIFHIVGVRESQQADDGVQQVLRSHLRQEHGVEHAFFKRDGAKFYADSARCSSCRSPEIVFDIELTEEILSAIVEMSGRSLPEIRSGIKETRKAIRRAEADAADGFEALPRRAPR
jgi:hypothetical protein